MAIVRLQKALAQAGLASRRAAEAMITAGRVRVDGRIVTELGTKVDLRVNRVDVDGQKIVAEDRLYVVLHKPRGVVSTLSDPEGRPTVKELLKGVPGRVFPIGRLDFATSGVLLATNDGDFAEALMHPRKAVPKTYVVKVHGEMQPPDLDAWRRGIQLEDGKTLPARVRMLRHEGGKTWFDLTITEGRNQQIRRMGDATGFRVMRLARVEVAGVTGEGLRPGAWRYLTYDELTSMKLEFGFPRKVMQPPPQPTPPRRAWAPKRDDDEMDRKPPAMDRKPPAADRKPPAADRRPHAAGGAPVARGDDRKARAGGHAHTPPSGEARFERQRGGGTRGSSGGRGGRSDRGDRGDRAQPHGPPPRRGQHSGGPPARADVGGMRMRTTGTGGGIGGEGESGGYRVRGRKG